MRFFIRSYALFLFIFAFNITAFSNGDEYFTKLYNEIEQNNKQELFEENFQLIEKIVLEEKFQALDCLQKGQIFHKIGLSYYAIYNDEEGLRFFKDSTYTYWQNCPEVLPTNRAKNLYYIGISYHYMFQPEPAKRYLDEALSIYENGAVFEPITAAETYLGVGRFYLGIKDYFRAEIYLKNALNNIQKIDGEEKLHFKIFNALLITSLENKNYEATKSWFDEAIKLQKQGPSAISRLNLFQIHLNVGVAYIELEEDEQALKKIQKAASFLDKEENPLDYAILLESLAELSSRKNNFKQALIYHEEVLKIRKKNPSNAYNHRILATAYENICRVYIKEKELPLAKEYLMLTYGSLLPSASYDKDGLPIIIRSVAFDNLQFLKTLNLHTAIFQEQFKETQDFHYLEQAQTIHLKMDSIINQTILSFSFEQSRLDLLNIIIKYYKSAIEDNLQLYQLTRETKFLETAYFFSSKTKYLIFETEQNQSAAFKSIATSELLKEEKELKDRVHNLHQNLLEKPLNSAALIQLYAQAQRELDEFILRIEQNFPVYHKQKYAFIQPPNIKELQKALSKETAVIEYFYDQDTIFSFWITKDHFFEISITNDDILKQQISSFANKCHNPKSTLIAEEGQKLYEQLLKKGLDELDETINYLQIIPSGPLHTLPFEAFSQTLKNEFRFLVEDYIFSYSYSTGTLLRKNKEQNKPLYIGFGTNYTPLVNDKIKSSKLFFGEENLGELTLAQEEINQCADIFSGKKFLNKQASLVNFENYANQASIIHLSLHGIIDVANPDRSYVLFDDNEEDYILTANDLHSYNLNADLVVLSACHTASGKIYHGEGVQGMSKAFLSSGAKNILSSLWSVSESGSLTIMSNFFKKVNQQNSKALALNLAKKDYLSTASPNFRHPFYWANYILIGELNNSNVAALSFLSIFKWILLLCLFILAFSFLNKKAK